jgi:hypothetical protein
MNAGRDAVDRRAARAQDFRLKLAILSIETQHAMLARGVRDRDEDAPASPGDVVVALTRTRVLPLLDQRAAVVGDDALGRHRDGHVLVHERIVKSLDFVGGEQRAVGERHAHRHMPLGGRSQHQRGTVGREARAETAAIADLTGRGPQHLARGALERRELAGDHIVHPHVVGGRLVVVHEHRPVRPDGKAVDDAG